MAYGSVDPFPGAVSGAYVSEGTLLLVFAGLLALSALAAAAYIGLWVRKPPTGSETKLLNELADSHHLSAEERSLLRRAASGAPYASIVFVDPSFLDRLAAADPREAARCGELRERLFGA